ncbi:dihydrofolate synthase/folylpolyglutamate synthase [Arcticibacter pallidicorallinus]|uniref:Dihydrofolate synthase/folylpolyglutamate synthase n=2 Tax=Arcticibacter pallidicorallinus TaxID=1259464 RepID=A0A2T0U317_9SPHI|nr:dihydrofolate synthase/folylpolyglutamate synthase [Arcticibacter pallidicorallinus]
MDYFQTVEYLYSRLPMFSRQGASAIKKDLHNTILLCESLGNPHHKFKTIHVAGTNGKGSVSHMLAAVLQVAGYKTGLYTSPHLRDFRERIRINGEMIPKEMVVSFVQEQQELIEKIDPSFFEVTVGMAFDYFARENVDIAIIETGLGGRLDSTNIIRPILSVITNIGFDHVAILGDTLPQIAREKAGIIKAGIPVVIGEATGEVRQVFLEKAALEGSPIYFSAEEWDVDTQEEMNEELLHLQVTRVIDSGPTYEPKFKLSLDLTGFYQMKNIKTVLSAIGQIRELGFSINDQQLYSSLKKVTTLTGLMGRWQTIGYQPRTICDTGHNEDGVREVLSNLKRLHYETLHFVIGMVKDKDIQKVLNMLPAQAEYYFCAPDIERAKPAISLKEEASALGLHGEAYNSVAEALMAARESASPEDLILVGGSTFVVAEVI